MADDDTLTFEGIMSGIAAGTNDGSTMTLEELDSGKIPDLIVTFSWEEEDALVVFHKPLTARGETLISEFTSWSATQPRFRASVQAPEMAKAVYEAVRSQKLTEMATTTGCQVMKIKKVMFDRLERMLEAERNSSTDSTD